MDRTLALVLGLFLIASAPSSARAATFTVDTTADLADPTPGDGKCGDAPGSCSLRAAIQECDRSSLANTIVLPPGTYALTIDGPDEAFALTGDLDVVGDVTISGAGASQTIVDGGAIDRVFDIAPKANVTLSDLTIRNGLALGNDGGGILNNGHLKLRSVVVQGNRAKGDPLGQNGRGGGICNHDHLEAMSLTVGGNVADGKGGGVFSDGIAKLLNSTVTGNASETIDGGGISNTGQLGLLLVSLVGNRAINAGGLDNVQGEVDVANSTVSGNRASSAGGGIRNSGKLTVVNSTIDGNTAGTIGGGLLDRGGGKAEFNNATIAGNSAGEKGGGIASESGSTVSLGNSILATNTAPGGNGSDCSGTLDSRGYNLIQNQGGCSLTGSPTGNLENVDPKLAPLAANDGPTETRALLAGSPAIDAGNPAPPTGSDGACAAADQRGVKRPVDGSGSGKPICDIGAYELQPRANPG